jgi:integrase/recombinase XerD
MSTDTTVSSLRQRMIEDMAARKLGSHSQRSHIYGCRRFAAFLNRCPDTATADDIRGFQLHMVEAGLSITVRNRIMTGVRFLFRVTCGGTIWPPRSTTSRSHRSYLSP